MATAAKPTLIWIPGAWHSPSCYVLVMAQLVQQGYPCITVPLPSVGAKVPVSTFDEDVAAIHTVTSAAVERGEDVVVIMHSYGGIPGCEAMKGLAKKDRQASGKDGGVIRLFFCCSFVLPVGGCLWDALGRQAPPWFSMFNGDKEVLCATPGDVFYNDLSASIQSQWSRTLVPQSFRVFHSKLTYAAYQDIPSSYLFCEADGAIPFAAQQGMVAGSGVEFQTTSCKAGHSPFLSEPDAVVNAILKACS